MHSLVLRRDRMSCYYWPALRVVNYNDSDSEQHHITLAQFLAPSMHDLANLTDFVARQANSQPAHAPRLNSQHLMLKRISNTSTEQS